MGVRWEKGEEIEQVVDSAEESGLMGIYAVVDCVGSAE